MKIITGNQLQMLTVFPNFLWEEKGFLISVAPVELLKFEKWPQVLLRNYNSGEESSPVLSTHQAFKSIFINILLVSLHLSREFQK